MSLKIKTDKIKVIEVSQFIPYEDIIRYKFKDFENNKAGIKSYKILEVSKDSAPMLGSVWHIAGRGGKLKIWKTNYDSSG
jgi:hypothetical protein